MATFNELIAQLNASSDNILSNADRLNTTANNMNQTLDGIGIGEVSGIAELQPERTIGEQIYADQQINNQYLDNTPDFGYVTSKFQERDASMGANYDPFRYNFNKVTSNIGDFANKYGKKIAGGIMSLASGVPGLGLVMDMLPKNNPQNQFMLDTYGGYGDMGRQDKFGYNIVSGTDNYLNPGSNSFRSHQLEGLRGLDQTIANDFYQQNYGKTYDQVYKDSQNKIDPFNQTVDVGSGADYYGGGNNQADGSGGYTGGFDSSTNNYSDPYSDDTE
tara:strand:- start:44 stop:868 length:825 start_codon:yes stop_codon:yes gene_type:complete